MTGLAHSSAVKIFAALGLCALTLTACAPGVDKSAGAVEKSFLTKVTADCEAALANSAPSAFPYPSFVATDPAPSQLPSAGAYYDSLPFNHDELAFVKSFGQPAHGRAAWKAFVDLVGQEQTIVANQITAAKASDKAAFVSTVNQVAAIQTKIDSAAKQVGFAADSYCVQLYG